LKILQAKNAFKNVLNQKIKCDKNKHLSLIIGVLKFCDVI